MTRFYGKVGYGTSEMVVGGVWTDDIVERVYSGEVLTNIRNLVANDKVNDDIGLQKQISIVADAFAVQNYLQIKYVDDAGSLWTVTSARVQRPRIILSLGGVYNGPRPTP